MFMCILLLGWNLPSLLARVFVLLAKRVTLAGYTRGRRSTMDNSCAVDNDGDGGSVAEGPAVRCATVSVHLRCLE
jgi:hypothetical protein